MPRALTWDEHRAVKIATKGGNVPDAYAAIVRDHFQREYIKARHGSDRFRTQALLASFSAWQVIAERIGRAPPPAETEVVT